MSLWYTLVRQYVSIGISIYFKEIRVTGTENIPLEGPIMFTVNHQNSFLDALLIATSNNRHTHFLVRADAFKFKIVRWFFNSLNMMPIYRMRDGRGSLSNNDQIFQKCFRILANNHALMLFPEADHHQKRLLLPLSKGFTRIALGADSAIKIVPVGINYTHHRLFGGSVSIYYGKPISTRAYQNGDPQDNRLLRNEVNLQMQKLITCIPDDRNYQVLENHLNQTPLVYLDPEYCNQWVIQADPEHLLIVNRVEKPALFRTWVRALSFLLNFPPLVLCNHVLKKIKDPVFTGSIKFTTGIILLPIYYLLLALVVYTLWSFVGAMVVIFFGVLSLMARKWSLTY